MLPQFEISDCGFKTEPAEPIYSPIDSIKFTFDTAHIKNQLNKIVLDPNAYLEWSVATDRWPCQERKDTHSIGSREAVNLLPATIQAIQDRKKDREDPNKNNDFECDDVYIHGNTIEINYVIGSERSTLCRGEYKIEKEMPGYCEIDVHYDVQNGTGNIDDPSWEYAVTKISLPKKWDGIDIAINKHSVWSGRLPAKGEVIRPIPLDVRKAGTNLIEVWGGKAYCYTDEYGNQLCNVATYELICPSKVFEMAPAGETLPTPTITPHPSPTPQVCGQIKCSDPNKSKSERCSGECSICPGCPGSVPPVKNFVALKPICEQLPDIFRSKCNQCQEDGQHVWTAIGCLDINFSSLINKYVFTTGIGFAGAVAFLYFLYGSFLILTCGGNAEQLAQAKQIIVSSITGLILIIFSIFFLKVIGVDILKLPGFQ